MPLPTGPNTLGVLQALQSIILTEALVGGVSPFAALSAADATRYGVSKAVFIGRPKDSIADLIAALLALIVISQVAFALADPALSSGAVPRLLGYVVAIGACFFCGRRLRVQAQSFSYAASAFPPAFQASPAAGSPRGCLWRQLMAILAACAPAVMVISARNVELERDRFEVIRPHASPVSAQVIEDKFSVWGAICQFVAVSVGEVDFSLRPERSVSLVVEVPCPVPTAILDLFNVCVESRNVFGRLIHGAAPYRTCVQPACA